MVFGPLVLLTAAMFAAPDTPIGRFLRHLMVERPAAALARLTLGHILRGAALVIAVAVMFWLMQDNGLQFLAGAAPDAVTWLLAFDVSTLLEAAAVLAVTVSAVRFGAIRKRLRNILPRRFTRTGRREQRSKWAGSARSPKAANDNEEERRRPAA